MSAIIDRSVFKVFLIGGANSGTMVFFPEYIMDTLIVKTSGLNEGASASLVVWGLESGWTTVETANGTVAGNFTTSARVRRNRAGSMRF